MTAAQKQSKLPQSASPQAWEIPMEGRTISEIGSAEPLNSKPRSANESGTQGFPQVRCPCRCGFGGPAQASVRGLVFRVMTLGANPKFNSLNVPYEL